MLVPQLVTPHQRLCVRGCVYVVYHHFRQTPTFTYTDVSHPNVISVHSNANGGILGDCVCARDAKGGQHQSATSTSLEMSTKCVAVLKEEISHSHCAKEKRI